MNYRKQVGVGVVGAGLFSEQCHIPGIQSHPDAEVLAVCARSQARRERLQSQFGVQHSYADYRELLERRDINAIVVAGPDSLHSEVSLAALASGKHVFCEKPLAMDVAEASTMTGFAEKSGLINMVSFVFRYTRAVQELKHLLEIGFIGTPLHAHVQIHWGDLLAPKALTWREDAAQSAGGIWADAGSHVFDLLAHVLGPVEAVCAQMLVAKRPEGSPQPTTIDIASCQARVTGKSRLPVQVLVHMSRISAPLGAIHDLMIVGTEGSLGIPLTRGNTEYLKMLTPGSSEWKNLPLERDAFTDEPRALGRMMGAFVEAVKLGAPDHSTDACFREGLNAQLVLQSGFDSVKKSAWQKVPTVKIIAPALLT